MLNLSDFYELITMVCSVIMALIALITLIINLIVHIKRK